jgi:crotonobetainyl-CoA:carnitine CoA-transferase CaiB-like acyl-CoA transferase
MAKGLEGIKVIELEKFNLTYEALAKVNPKLIYAPSRLELCAF